MEMYIVHNSVGGFNRDTPCQSNIIGAYLDRNIAQKIATVASAHVHTVTINEIPAKLKNYMASIGMKTPTEKE